MAATTPSYPPFMSIESLAAHLDMSESHIRDLVEQGVLPRPIALSKRCVRYDWSAVQNAIRARAKVRAGQSDDPFMSGADSVS
ncbi:helix-turn-helix transcriptional regulator [Rhizobium sp.]